MRWGGVPHLACLTHTLDPRAPPTHPLGRNQRRRQHRGVPGAHPRGEPCGVVVVVVVVGVPHLACLTHTHSPPARAAYPRPRAKLAQKGEPAQGCSCQRTLVANRVLVVVVVVVVLVVVLLVVLALACRILPVLHTHTRPARAAYPRPRAKPAQEGEPEQGWSCPVLVSPSQGCSWSTPWWRTVWCCC
jgi:hypothetical protein